MSTTARENARVARQAAKWQAEFQSLARRFYAGVYNYLCYVSRDAGLAEDLTQETFMRIWQNPPELRDKGALRAWVYRVARNEFLQHRRRAGLSIVAFDDCPEAEHFEAVAADPQARLEIQNLCLAVRRAVGMLPDLYREVIVLHNLEQLSLAQIAQVLEVPVGTVKSRRAKAFSALRHLLQEEVVGNEV